MTKELEDKNLREEVQKEVDKLLSSYYQDETMPIDIADINRYLIQLLSIEDPNTYRDSVLPKAQLFLEDFFARDIYKASVLSSGRDQYLSQNPLKTMRQAYIKIKEWKESEKEDSFSREDQKILRSLVGSAPFDIHRDLFLQAKSDTLRHIRNSFCYGNWDSVSEASSFAVQNRPFYVESLLDDVISVYPSEEEYAFCEESVNYFTHVLLPAIFMRGFSLTIPFAYLENPRKDVPKKDIFSFHTAKMYFEITDVLLCKKDRGKAFTFIGGFSKPELFRKIQKGKLEAASYEVEKVLPDSKFVRELLKEKRWSLFSREKVQLAIAEDFSGVDEEWSEYKWMRKFMLALFVHQCILSGDIDSIFEILHAVSESPQSPRKEYFLSEEEDEILWQTGFSFSKENILRLMDLLFDLSKTDNHSILIEASQKGKSLIAKKQ